ncbi:hypothetical protein GOV11_04250 [Candidatus Woesearchaeota archaeon]|nr:hypothetical protein [Candidatus Woesearchaeota archaeon]
MQLPTPRQYKKTFHIGDNEWSLKFKRKMQFPDTHGLMDPETHTIYIKQGLTHGETFYVFIHEVVHAIEVEYDLYLSESQVLKLEKGLGDFVLTNV